ncbi:hypothetical protein P3T21_004157 [Paraburkholderia sp. GAS334]|jgi:hypothetical protein
MWLFDALPRWGRMRLFSMLLLSIAFGRFSDFSFFWLFFWPFLVFVSVYWRFLRRLGGVSEFLCARQIETCRLAGRQLHSTNDSW